MPHHEQYSLAPALVALVPIVVGDVRRDRCALCGHQVACVGRLRVQPAGAREPHAHDLCASCTRIASRLLVRLEEPTTLGGVPLTGVQVVR